MSSVDRRRGWPRLVLTALLGAVACSGGTMVPSPLVRVDLRDQLPRPVLRRLMAVDTTYECSGSVTLEQGGASQRFEVTWRVFEYRGDRYITAAQVSADGPTRGGTAPTATGTVGALKTRRTSGGTAHTRLPVHISWSAREGCSEVSARTTFTARTDAAGCERPRGTLKILSGSQDSGDSAASRDSAPGGDPAPGDPDPAGASAE